MRVESTYLLANAQLRARKDGGQFLTMALKDASGKVTSVMWDNFDAFLRGEVRENGFVEITGEVITYNSQLQMRVTRLRAVDDSEIDPVDFLPVSPVPRAKLEAEFSALRAQVQDPDYQAILARVFDHPQFYERFCVAPSATSMHQAYLHGLLDHTICVAKNAMKLADNYPAVNRDLLLTAALLHDMGKTVEYEFDKRIAYTDTGRLIGHITIGYGMLEVEFSRLPDFPPSKKVILQHLVLSHHGKLEYGSPRLPATLEALLLHHADIIDAQVANYLESRVNAGRQGARWEYSGMLERHMFGPYEDVGASDLAGRILRPLPGDGGPVGNPPSEPPPD